MPHFQDLCHIFVCFFYWICRDGVEFSLRNGELPLKNDDLLLNNGRLFCNSRYQHTTVMAKLEAKLSVRSELIDLTPMLLRLQS